MSFKSFFESERPLSQLTLLQKGRETTLRERYAGDQYMQNYLKKLNHRGTHRYFAKSATIDLNKTIKPQLK